MLPDPQTLPYRQPGTVDKVRDLPVRNGVAQAWFPAPYRPPRRGTKSTYHDGVRQALSNYNKRQPEPPSAVLFTDINVSLSLPFAACKVTVTGAV